MDFLFLCFPPDILISKHITAINNNIATTNTTTAAAADTPTIVFTVVVAFGLPFAVGET